MTFWVAWVNKLSHIKVTDNADTLPPDADGIHRREWRQDDLREFVRRVKSYGWTIDLTDVLEYL